MNQPDGPDSTVHEVTLDLTELRVPIDRSATNVVVDITRPVPSIVGQHYAIDGTHEAEVFGPEHPIVAGIIDLEVQQLVDLGDREDESRAWLIDRTGSAWIALFERGANRVASNVLGVIRVTGSAASDRVLKDLAVLQRSTPEDIEGKICSSLDIDTIRPFVDFTTLDITAAGAKSPRDRAHNFSRLLTALTLSALQIGGCAEARVSLALVHPPMWKVATRLGIPFDDPGFGIMDYKLTDENLTPMQTRLVVQNSADTVVAIRGGHFPFMTEVGRIAELNGIDLDQALTVGAAMNGRFSSATVESASAVLG